MGIRQYTAYHKIPPSLLLELVLHIGLFPAFHTDPLQFRGCSDRKDLLKPVVVSLLDRPKAWPDLECMWDFPASMHESLL